MGSYIMMNVCGVVISTQFSDNLEHLRRRETRRENSDVLGEWLCSKWTGCLAVIRRRASNRSLSAACKSFQTSWWDFCSNPQLIIGDYFELFCVSYSLLLNAKGCATMTTTAGPTT